MARNQFGFQRLTVVKLQRPIVALTLVLGFVSSAHADPIRVTYTTEGVVGASSLYASPILYWQRVPPGSQSQTGPVGIDGMPVISFQGVNNGTLTDGQPFSLGQFVVAPMPAGTSTTYTNTPFQIAFTEHTVNGAAPSPNATPVVLDGWLSGTVSANSSSDIHIGINSVLIPVQGTAFPITIPAFRAGDYQNYLYIVSAGGTYSPIEAELNLVQSVPEPGAIVIFGLVGVALIHYHRRRSPRPT